MKMSGRCPFARGLRHSRANWSKNGRDDCSLTIYRSQNQIESGRDTDEVELPIWFLKSSEYVIRVKLVLVIAKGLNVILLADELGIK